MSYVSPLKVSDMRKGCLTFFTGCFVLYLVLVLVHTVWTLAEREVNYRKWLDTRPQTYSVTIEYGTYGGIYNRVQELVSDDTVLTSSIMDVRPTIDYLFDKVIECAYNTWVIVLSCEIEYDPQYGFPTSIRVADVDLGETTRTTNFQPLP